MKIAHRVLAAFCGTSCMTAYSYAFSFLSGRQYREPVLLSHLLSHSPREPALYSGKKKAAAWLIHYGVGVLFSCAFRSQQLKGNAREAAARGILLGAAFGCVGVSGWQLAFMLHPNPPKIKKGGYLLHLMPAHLIFGSSAALAAHFLSTGRGERKKEETGGKTKRSMLLEEPETQTFSYFL